MILDFIYEHPLISGVLFFFGALAIGDIINWLNDDEPEEEPACFADFPHRHYQEQAERDCEHCTLINDCFEATPYRHRSE